MRVEPATLNRLSACHTNGTGSGAICLGVSVGRNPICLVGPQGVAPRGPGHGAQCIGQTSRQVPKHTVAFWLGETSEHSHLPQNQPGLGGVARSTNIAPRPSLCPFGLSNRLALTSLSTTSDEMRFVTAALPRTTVQHSVSACPSGRRLAPPTGCPTGYTRIRCSDGSSEDKSFCSANSDPAGAHPQGGMLCLDTQQKYPCFGPSTQGSL
jgi:hypothetical protein